MVKKIAVLVSGGGSNLQAIIDNITDINGNIVLVVSNKESAFGLTRAQNANIPTKVISKDDEKLIQTLKEYEVDLVVLAGYLAILTPEFINAFKDKIINIHPSLIPSFCGKGAYGINVAKMALQRGVKITGVTIHFVSEIVDGGPIIAQRAVDIADLNTAEDIQQRVLKTEHELLPWVIKKYCDDEIIIEDGRVKIK